METNLERVLARGKKLLAAAASPSSFSYASQGEVETNLKQTLLFFSLSFLAASSKFMMRTPTAAFASPPSCTLAEKIAYLPGSTWYVVVDASAGEKMRFSSCC